MQETIVHQPTVADIADSMDPRQTRILHDLFAASDVRAPSVTWDPTDADLRDARMERFAKVCRAAAGPDGSLPIEAASSACFDIFRDWLVVVDCEGDGDRFRYRHFGRSITEAYGRDMRGALSTDLDGPVALFISAVYRAARLSAEWVLTEHEPGSHVFVSVWRRLVVPLSGRDGSVEGFLVMSQLENDLRPGLAVLPDPVFVLDADCTIRFANSAAQEVFGPLALSAGGMPFREATGIDLKPRVPPGEMVVSRRIHDEVALALRDSLLAEFEFTVSGAMLRSRAYYIVVLRVKLS